MRTYDDDDGPQVKSLLDDAYAWDAHYAPQSHDEWLAFMTDHDEFDPSLWFLVERNGELVACALHWKEHNRRGWLKDLAVHESIRGAGLGKSLVRHGLRAYAGSAVSSASGSRSTRRTRPARRPLRTRRVRHRPAPRGLAEGAVTTQTTVSLAALVAAAAARAVAAARAARSGDRERRSG